MITIQLTPAQAALFHELLRTSTEDVLEQITESIGELATQDHLVEKASENYVINLENKVKELEKALNEKPAAKPAAKVNAPYGYKKDGTPKARPGRKV